MPQAPELKPDQIRHLLRVTAASRRHPEPDGLVLLLGISTGMRITEIAQIEAQDVLLPSAALREEVSRVPQFQKDAGSAASIWSILRRSTRWSDT